LLHSSDIPGLTTPPSADAGRQKASRDWSYDERWRLSRATFLKGVLGTAVVSSVGALELFPLAPQARADGYDIYSSYTSGPCGAGQYASGHGCTPGCGPSSVCANKSCCSGGYHRNDGSTFSGYSLRPNQCWAGVYDGWRWRCNSTTIYRCHDGWTYSGSSKWKTICRHDTV
jgi:hypothetical protein